MRNWIEREARRLGKARTLLQPAVEEAGGIWADLGCGDGIFTYLLCTLLWPGSEIYAVDKDKHALRALQRNIVEPCSEVMIHFLEANFTRQLSLPPLDGLVMANSLHFVEQKKPVITQLMNLLKPGGRFIIVEYNTNRSNYAVPHPLSETEFLSLAQAVGLRKVRIVAKAPSTFLGEMYTGTGLVDTRPLEAR